MELASSSVRLVQPKTGGEGHSIGRSAEVEFPPEVYKDGQIFNPTLFGKRLRASLREVGGGKEVALSVGISGILIRRVGLPKLKPADLRHLMETQGDQWIPFLREGAAFDLTVVNPNAGEHQQEVLITAVPIRYIDYARSVLRLAGLKLARLDVDISALYRAAVAARRAPAEGTVAVVDLFGEKPRIGLFHQGGLVGTRVLETRAVRPIPGARGDSLYGDELPVEIRRALELLSTPLQEEARIGCLILNDPARDQALSAGLEREMAQGFSSPLAPDFRLLEGIGGSLQPNMVLAYGLSLSEVEQPRTYNLLPQPTIRYKRQMRLSLIISVALLAVLGAYGFYWSQAMPALEAEQRAKSRTLTQLKKELDREKEIALAEQKAKLLQPFLDDLNVNDPWSVALPNLKAVLPRGVKLNSVSGSPPELALAGTAPSPDLVADLMNALEKSPYFVEPILQNSGAGEGQVSFQIKVKMEKRGGRTSEQRQ